MGNACLLRGVGQGDALSGLALGVLRLDPTGRGGHEEQGLHPVEGGDEARGLVRVGLHEFHAALNEDLGAVRGGIAHESADAGALREQRVEDGTALLAGGSVDGDGSKVGHGVLLR